MTRNQEQLPVITLRGPGFPSDGRPQTVVIVSDEVRGGLYPQFVRIPLQKTIQRGKSAVAPKTSLFHIEGKSLLKTQTTSPVTASLKAAWVPTVCAVCYLTPCQCRKSVPVRTSLKVPGKARERGSVERRGVELRAQTAPTASPESGAMESLPGEDEEDDSLGSEDSQGNAGEEDAGGMPGSPPPELRVRETIDPEIRPGDGQKTWLLLSLFKGRPPTVLFDYPPQCSLPSKVCSRTVRMSVIDEEAKSLHYRYSESAHVYNCVVTALEYNGFSETTGNRFNLYISGSIRPKILLEMDEYQKYNHYPGSWQLGRKDNLWRNVSKQRRVFGEEYSFCPNTYLLPDDYDRFLRDREEHPKQLWIYKPVASACGRGIRVLSNKSKVRRKHGYLISSYISNPHLINGLKYDLRLYVCVSSYDPLRIYLYKEGLVRFATQAYTTSRKSVVHRYIHLTNYSVNKRAANYQFNQQAMKDNQGSKWSHTALKKTFASLGIDPEVVFARVKDVIIKTIIAAEPLLVNSIVQYTKNRGNCFETYGFDVLLDERLRPWLMEVNVSPSLNNGSPLDKRIKTALMSDIYSLVGFVPYDRKKIEENIELKKQQRMLGLLRTKRKRPTIQAIRACQRLEDLDLDDTEVAMLMDTEEEAYRSGNFERVFPTKETIPAYARFLQTDRVNNLLTWKLLMDDSVFLRRFLAESTPLLKV